MKVKIIMEADVTDLPSFSPDGSALDINGVGRMNIYDVVKELYLNSLMKLMKERAEAKDNPTPIQKAMILTYEDERKLTKQLIKSIKIKFS